MCESVHCRDEEWSIFGGWFSWFRGRQLVNKWLCTTQNWLFRVVIVERLRHVQFFRNNRRSFAWKCFVCAGNFCWICLILKYPDSRLLFAFRLIHVNPRFITYHDVIDVFRSVSFHQSMRAFFWAFDKLCEIQREQILLTSFNDDPDLLKRS